MDELKQTWKFDAASLAVTALCFGLVIRHPMEVSTDAAIQLRSLLEWLDGKTRAPNFLTLPDPDDLSRDLEFWISWWPPGLAYLFAPFVYYGMKLGTAVRLLNFCLVFCAALGWSRVARTLNCAPHTKWALAVVVPTYSIAYCTTFAAFGLSSADVVVFAVFPWLVLLGVRFSSSTFSLGLLRAAQLGVTFGLIAVFKSSGLVLAVALMAAAACLRLWAVRGSKAQTRDAVVIGVVIVASGICPLALSLLNRWLGAEATGLTQFAQQDFGTGSGRDARALVSLLGGPGLALFQWNDALRHVLFIRNWPRWLKGDERELLASALGASVALAAGVLLWAAARSMRLTLWLGPVALALASAILAALGCVAGYEFLGGDAGRYLGPLALLVELSLLEAAPLVWSSRHELATGRRWVTTCAIVWLSVIALGAVGFRFGRIASRIGKPTNERGVARNLGVYIPEAVDIGPDAIGAILNGGGSGASFEVALIVLPHHPGPFGVWLATTKRSSVPLYFEGPFAGHLRPKSQWESSRGLRVALVTLGGEQDNASVLNLKSKFLCNGGWSSVVSVDATSVEACELGANK